MRFFFGELQEDDASKSCVAPLPPWRPHLSPFSLHCTPLKRSRPLSRPEPNGKFKHVMAVESGVASGLSEQRLVQQCYDGVPAHGHVETKNAARQSWLPLSTMKGLELQRQACEHGMQHDSWSKGWKNVAHLRPDHLARRRGEIDAAGS